MFPSKEAAVKHLSVRLLIVAGAILIGLVAFARPTAATASSTRVAQLEAIDELRTETWRWQSLMRKPRTPTLFRERRTSDAAYLRWIRDLWQRRAGARRASGRESAAPQPVALHPPLRAQPDPGLAHAHRQRLFRRPADGHRLPAHRTAPSCCAGRARRTTGPPSSRCGSPSGPTGAGAASIPGRTPPATAA